MFKVQVKLGNGNNQRFVYLTEGRNTGFRKILGAIKANGAPLPEFETDGAHDYFVSRFFIHKGFYGSLNDSVLDGLTESSGSTTAKTTPKTTIKVKPSQVVMKFLKENPKASVRDVSLKLNLSLDGARYRLNKLKKSGNIHHEGPSNCGYWVIDTLLD